MIHTSIIRGFLDQNLVRPSIADNRGLTVLFNGFTPTISVATHLKPNTILSCIDNILTNNVENILKSGVIETHISHCI